MNIATNLDLSAAEVAALRPAVVTQIPNLTSNYQDITSKRLIEGGFDVLITGRMPTSSVLREWSRARGRDVVVLVKQAFRQTGYFAGRCDGALQVFFGSGDTSISAALSEAERIYTREVTARDAVSMISRMERRRASETVLVVGAGAVGLMTALYLSQAGFKVDIVDANDDPRCVPDWRSLGCTHGGANARMFSLTECDNYHDRDATANATLHNHLCRSVADLGWLIGRPESYPTGDETWLCDSLAMPVWLAERYNDDIFTLNHESLSYWRDLMTAYPDLFQGVELCEPLLRIASTAAYHAKQIKRQKHVGAYLADLNPAMVAAAYPALADGVASGEIAGGIEVLGFTVNVHGFAKRLIDHLARCGVVFHWGVRAEEVITRNGAVVGITVQSELQHRDHYFVSPGVYGRELLRSTTSDGKVHGVLGAWMSIPNLEPRLSTALKVARDGHVAGSGNIIPGRDGSGNPILIFGSGFGYVGDDPSNIDQRQLDALYDSMEEYLAIMFPEAFQLALADGSLRGSRKYCIRPWTASSLGTFEVRPAEDGLFVVASGHNTGGFAQSPAVGRATLDAFQGRIHAMHVLYHPRRYEAFWLGRNSARRPTVTASAQQPAPQAA